MGGKSSEPKKVKEISDRWVTIRRQQVPNPSVPSTSDIHEQGAGLWYAYYYKGTLYDSYMEAYEAVKRDIKSAYLAARNQVDSLIGLCNDISSDCSNSIRALDDDIKIAIRINTKIEAATKKSVITPNYNNININSVFHCAPKNLMDGSNKYIKANKIRKIDTSAASKKIDVLGNIIKEVNSKLSVLREQRECYTNCKPFAIKV